MIRQRSALLIVGGSYCVALLILETKTFRSVRAVSAAALVCPPSLRGTDTGAVEVSGTNLAWCCVVPIPVEVSGTNQGQQGFDSIELV